MPFTIVVSDPPPGRFGNLRSSAKSTMVSVRGVLTGVNDSEVAEINLESVTFTSYTNRPGFSSSGSGSSPPSLTLATVDRTKRQDGSLKSFKKIRMGSSSALWTVMTPPSSVETLANSLRRQLRHRPLDP